MSDKPPSHILLIATVGGAAAPLVASIRKWRPARILFVPSSGTVDQIDDIRRLLARDGYDLGVGLCETITVSDHQNFSCCVREMQSGLEQHVVRWYKRGKGYECVADFTGGTKCMSAALALVARPWPAVRFSYVGGMRRDKDDVGVVVAGEEQVVSVGNPWDALGYQVVEEAVAAFDRHAYGWGARQLQCALKHVESDGSRKSELSTLAAFMEGYDLWDRSHYAQALDKFEQCGKRLNDLAAALPGTERDRLREHIEQARSRLRTLKQALDHPTRAQLEDLIANAARRREEGRHVDAVARLYRTVEATAQLRLWEHYEIDTAKVSPKDLPGPVRDRVALRAEDGTAKLALQDAYEVLRQWEDPLGERFGDLGLNGSRSPLSERNQSIAGHGFKPVSPGVSDKLWNAALSLAGIAERDVVRFPTLGAG